MGGRGEGKGAPIIGRLGPEGGEGGGGRRMNVEILHGTCRVKKEGGASGIVHKYTCLLFGTCHTSCKTLSRQIPFHANKTSPRFWKVSYLVQSDLDHQVQRNDILQERSVHPSRL